ATLPTPLDITGFIFDLDARASAGAATIALRATSDPDSPAIERVLNGGAAGTLAMGVPRASMAKAPPGTYPYNILATDPATGQRVTAFYGVIVHQAVLQPNA
ncbi:MAG: hypothetical protein INR63_12830, partial [Actinomycetospora chiangmaiensis]|nr:hypothetical protein [Actinomycetospora chiangmaiensis]